MRLPSRLTAASLVAPRRVLLARLAEPFLELAFPSRCAACGEPARTPSAAFCAVCEDAVLPLPRGCPRCGRPGLAERCGGCEADPPPFDGLAAGALFGGPVADAVHALKYQDRPALARPLGLWLASRVALAPGAVLVPVPLSSARRRARGYDQAALLARALARAAGAGATVLGAALRRARDTPPQVGQRREDRVRNVAGAFEPAQRLDQLDVALVDDVVTTGATAAACAEALRRGGARTVRVVALARAE